MTDDLFYKIGYGLTLQYVVIVVVIVVVVAVSFFVSYATVVTPIGIFFLMFCFSKTFCNYPPGLRFISLEIRASDGQNWKGPYGPRTTDATVQISRGPPVIDPVFPIPTSGLMLWLNASSLKINDSSRVDTWNSEVGFARVNCSSDEPDFAAVFVSTAINGKPAVRFSGKTSFQIRNQSRVWQYGTIIAVAKQSVSNLTLYNAQCIFCAQDIFFGYSEVIFFLRARSQTRILGKRELPFV